MRFLVEWVFLRCNYFGVFTRSIFVYSFLGEFLTAFLFKDISKIGGQVNNLLAKYTVALMHVCSCTSWMSKLKHAWGLLVDPLAIFYVVLWIVEIGYAALSTSVSVDKIIFVVIVCNLLLNGVTSYKSLPVIFIGIPFFTLRRPCRGGGDPMLPVWILKCIVSVFINACHLLSALPSLLQFGRGRLSLVVISFYALSLLSGPCHLLEFTLAGSH